MIPSLSVVILGFACGLAGAVNPLVNVDYSKYEGTALPNGISQWLGIRFAAPPLGDLRFRVPADPLQNDTVQIANEHGPICLGTGLPYPTAGQSEDCLFLDVYAPSHATSSSLLPVYIWIQGGGFNDNSNPNYNGSGLITASDMDMVVVTFNYRVGPYGFLSGKEVQKNGDLNVGLFDQRKVMEWVQKYISRFGGNPDHVVLGGASSGAVSIVLHLTAYGGKPTNLFHGVFGESQAFPAELTVPETEYQYNNLTARVGCAGASDTLACLRATDISVLQNANINVPFPGRSNPPLYMYSSVIDGDFIQDYHYRMFAQGRFLKVPSVFGDDTNEGTVFTPTTINSPAEQVGFIADQFPQLSSEQGAKITSLYPEAAQFPNHGAYYSAAANAYGEIRYICPGNFVSASIAKFRSPLPNWNYHYNVIDPVEQAEGLGVPHTIEVNAAWGPNNTGGGAPASYSTTNAAIVPVVQGYWTSFIRSLDPNVHRASGTPEWSPFGTDQRRILLQTNATAVESVPSDQKSRCAYLESIGIDLQQ